MKIEVQQNFITVLIKTHYLLNFMCIMVILQNLIYLFFKKLITDNGHIDQLIY